MLNTESDRGALTVKVDGKDLGNVPFTGKSTADVGYASFWLTKGRHSVSAYDARGTLVAETVLDISDDRRTFKDYVFAPGAHGRGVCVVRESVRYAVKGADVKTKEGEYTLLNEKTDLFAYDSIGVEHNFTPPPESVRTPTVATSVLTVRAYDCKSGTPFAQR